MEKSKGFVWNFYYTRIFEIALKSYLQSLWFKISDEVMIPGSVIMLGNFYLTKDNNEKLNSCLLTITAHKEQSKENLKLVKKHLDEFFNVKGRIYKGPKLEYESYRLIYHLDEFIVENIFLLLKIKGFIKN